MTFLRSCVRPECPPWLVGREDYSGLCATHAIRTMKTARRRGGIGQVGTVYVAERHAESQKEETRAPRLKVVKLNR